MNAERRAALLRLLPELVVNLLLPWLAYALVEGRCSEAQALMVSALPPLAWSVVELIRHRRLDALSVIVLGGIALSLLALLLGGDARMMLMRESLISGLIGLAFLGSLLLGRPLVALLARTSLARQSPQALADFEARGQHPVLQAGLSRITLIWGLGLCGETALRAWLAWTWPTERFLLVSPFISYGLMGLLVLLTLWQRRRMQTEMAPLQQAQSATPLTPG